MKTIHWINQEGEKIALSDMDTRYLYNCVKMIFNNVINIAHPFGKVIPWTFKKNHPFEYLVGFYEVGLGELKAREDNAIALEFIKHAEIQSKQDSLSIVKYLERELDWEEKFGWGD